MTTIKLILIFHACKIHSICRVSIQKWFKIVNIKSNSGGPGLSEEILEKVFYKNYEDFTSRKPVGTVIESEIDWSRMNVKKLDRKPGQAFPPPTLTE